MVKISLLFTKPNRKYPKLLNFSPPLELVFWVRYCRIINKLTAFNFVLEVVNLSRMFRKSLLLIISQILTKINSLAKIKQGGLKFKSLG